VVWLVVLLEHRRLLVVLLLLRHSDTYTLEGGGILGARSENDRIAGSGASTKEGESVVQLRKGALKRILVLVTVGITVASVLVAGGSSVGSTQEAMERTAVCAPWSKAWDISEGQWYFSWYRWCYDPALFDPAQESSWYTENGNWEWGEKANLCPESGTCTMSPGESIVMSTGTP
jgi:hypothetical protein